MVGNLAVLSLKVSLEGSSVSIKMLVLVNVVTGKSMGMAVLMIICTDNLSELS